MKYILTIALILMMPLSSVAQGASKKVAIYITGDINQGYKKVIGSKMVSNITQSNEYIAIERTADFLETLSREQDYQISGMVSDNQIAKIGAQFGVQYVIAADATELFGSIFISARMINVETAQIIASTELERKVSSMQVLMSLASEVSEALMGELLDQYQGLLDKVEVNGPISSTSQMPQNGIKTFQLREIQYIAKALSRKGRSCYPVLIDAQPRYVPNLTIWEISILNADNTTSSISASVNVFDDNGMLRVSHSNFPTHFYIFKRIY